MSHEAADYSANLDPCLRETASAVPSLAPIEEHCPTCGSIRVVWMVEDYMDATKRLRCIDCKQTFGAILP